MSSSQTQSRRGAAAQRWLAVSLLCASLPASAQQLAVEDQRFSLERLRLSTTREGLIDVESAAVLPHLAWDFGLWVGYEKNPLVVNRISDGTRLGALVSDRVGASLFGSLGVLGFLEFGLELPVVLYQARASELPGALAPDAALGPLSATRLGDIRAAAKVRLLSQERYGVHLALMPAVSLPSGGGGQYSGAPGVEFAPEALLSRDFTHLRLGLNLGATLRGRSETLNQTVESELTGHFGVGYRFYSPDRSRGAPLELDASLAAAVSAARPFRQKNQNHLELRLMAAYDVNPALQVFVGTGLGLMSGWGTPDWRVFLGARYGKVLQAAKAAEPLPPPPDPDPDGDGLAAGADRCPDRAGPKENGGCPDEDADADGLVDRLDGCPTQAEDKDGFQDDDGCPDPDNDGDGVPDKEDRCPAVKGPASNRGCPDPDRDGDGLVDRLDNCPDEAGPPENQGCAARQLVIISEGQLSILEKVYFKTNSHVIEQRSFRLLNNVVAVLKAHPDVDKVLVEGHTDSQGSATKNLGLSERRAASVVKYLVDHGISPARLTPKGYGQTKPIADNKTAAGREKNRRVVFTILSGNGNVQSDDRDTEPDQGTR